MGVFGAALATVISTVVAFSIGFYILLKGNDTLKINFRGLFKLDWGIDKKLLTIGLPSGIEVLMRNLSGVFVLKFVSMYGTDTIAAVGIGTRLFSFAFMPIMGIVMGASTIVGQSLGADDVDRAKDTARLAALVNVIMMGILSILSLLFPAQIMKIFIKDPNVVAIGIPMIRLLVPSLILAGWAMGLGSVFTGSGHNTPFLLSSMISRWIVQMPMLYITTRLLHLPVIYAWLSFFVAEVAELIIVLIHYNKGIWKTKRV
jgi:putative MATE family efflux protein